MAMEYDKLVYRDFIDLAVSKEHDRLLGSLKKEFGSGETTSPESTLHNQILVQLLQHANFIEMMFRVELSKNQKHWNSTYQVFVIEDISIPAKKDDLRLQINSDSLNNLGIENIQASININSVNYE